MPVVRQEEELCVRSSTGKGLGVYWEGRVPR